MSDNEVSKVVIVGGGLVGSLSACFMAKRGYQVLVFEKRGDIRKAKQAQGKSINLALSHRGRRALRTIGLEKEVLENAIPMKGRLLHSLSGDTKAVLYDTVSNQCIYSIDRNYLNSKLLQATETYPNVKLFFEHKLINVNLDAGKTTFLNLNTRETLEIKADLVIGADGAFSTVRRYMERVPMFEFSQNYIEHGYLELCIPKERGHFMGPNHLHIWPRGEFMMIALPNQDSSWTVTLFMPFKMFQSLKTPADLIIFFENTFPDSICLIGEKELINIFFSRTPSPLVSIKCNPYHVGDKTLLLGDSAHAMVPFYGQGMNAGFEDCVVFDEILKKNKNDIAKSISEYSTKRKPNTHAICNLAMYNYLEMRDLVTRPSYLLRKYIDNFLFKLLSTTWIPLYNSISFSEMDYAKCVENRKWQDKVIQGIIGIQICFLAIFCYVIYNLF